MELLSAFEHGADGVIVVAGHAGGDRYPGATERVRRRVEQVRAMLKEVGVNPERLQYVEAADQGRAAMRAAMVDAVSRIASA